MASKAKDALSRAKSALRSSNKATVAVSEATPANISDDASFGAAYAATSTDTPQPQPQPRASSPPDGSPASKYKLRVTAGPSYDPSTHAVVTVNGASGLAFENAFARTSVRVRVREYTGLPSTAPAHAAYFDAAGPHARDRYSIAFAFVPKADLPAADCVWGPDFDRPVRDRLPPGFGTAFAIVRRWVDPGVECDAYADEPWLYGPALSCWFVLRVGGREEVAGVDEVQADVLEEGADGDGVELRERLGVPADADKRRKFFLDRANREKFVFEKGRLYQGDFFNPYLDFNDFALRLPGFSLGVLKYVDDKTHALRWVFKNRTTGDVYFVVVFNLLFGAELEEALRAEEGEEHGRKEA